MNLNIIAPRKRNKHFLLEVRENDKKSWREWNYLREQRERRAQLEQLAAQAARRESRLGETLVEPALSESSLSTIQTSPNLELPNVDA
jgi:hypothetical protein